MPRGLTNEMILALAQPVLRPAILFVGTFGSGVSHLWTGLGPVIWRGDEYQGLGTLVGASAVEETDDIKAGGITVSLSGVPASQISLALLDMRRNAPGVMYLALMQDDWKTIIPDPQIIFRGRQDTCTISDSLGGATIAVTYENELIDLERARAWRYTPQEQRRLAGNDTFLDYVPSLQDKSVRWGSTT